MEAATPLPSSSLPPSSSLNTSHSSEESESFVVVDKSSSLDENLRISQTNGEDRVEIKRKNERVLEGQSASHNGQGLLQRIQCLTKENEELKGVLVKNNKLLEDLASLQTNQKQNNETLCKGSDQAKDVVTKLRERNESLEAELKSEQEKNQQLEEQLEKLKEEMLNQSSAQKDDKSINPHQLLSLSSEIKRLENEKEKLESMEGDDCTTLNSMGSLTLQSNQTDLESLHSRCSKLETEKEILQVDLQKLMIEKEQIQQQYQNLEEEHQSVSKHLAELEEARAPDNTTAVDSELVAKLSRQLQEQTKSVNTLSEELDAVKQERETFKKRVDELAIELTKTGEERVPGDADLKEKYFRMKKQLWNYQKRENYIQDKENALLEKENTHNMQLSRQLQEQTKSVNTLSEELDAVKQERETFKKRVDELAIELTKTGEERVPGDADLKEKYFRMKKQLWNYQKRENYIQDKENALLEKENTHNMQLQQQSKDLERCLENVRKMEDALIEEKQKHEKEIQHLKKQLSETHEQEVLLLKEELHLKNEEMTAVQNSEKHLKEQLAKLQQEKQNLVIQDEQCKAESVEKEEEGKSLMRQLSEKHKQENFLLREKLRSTELALDSSQNNEEHLKPQVTQLIEENRYLARSHDDYIQRANAQMARLAKLLSKGVP
ncbi:putative leucine-rich repeat-containing protein DDB_G0290503 isoform X2 [Acropora muricata]|uniref:putative leucine-rich repeat-containing protein DDB_G0290503 isoform X2 n=1 Tax=Acropora muricata TaxID=159855 RepID=UPI0034E4AA69